jgi:hypothetical protein
MAKFQVIFYFNETKLTYVITVLVTSDQFGEMKKQHQTIKCYQPKTIWNQLKNTITKLINKIYSGWLQFSYLLFHCNRKLLSMLNHILKYKVVKI